MKRWPTKKLGEIAVVQMGQSPPGESYNTDGKGLPFFQGKAEFGDEYPTVSKWCSKPSRIADAGDILLSVRAPVGPTNFATERCCIGRGLAAIRGERNKCNQRYLRYYLKRFEVDIAARGVGSTFTAINRNDVEQLELAVPLLPEQDRIVKLLDEADQLRKLRAQADRRTSDLLPALFHEMFGDPIPNSLGWERAPLGSFLEFLTSGSRGWAKYYAASGARFLRIQNVGNNELLLDDLTYVTPPNNAEANRTKVRSGDVLLSITADLGRTAAIPDNFPATFINQHLALLRLRELDPTFVAATLSSPSAKSKWLDLNRAAVKSGLNFDDIRSFPMITPPLALQRQFAQRVTAIRELEAAQAASRERLEALFQSMLHRAFNGDL